MQPSAYYPLQEMGSISQPVSKVYDLTTSNALSNKNIYSYLKMLETVSPCWVSMSLWRAWFISNHNSSSYIAQPTEGSSRHDIPTLFHHTRRQRDLSKHYVMLISIKWFCCLKNSTSLPFPLHYVQPATPCPIGGEQNPHEKGWCPS